MQKSVNRMKFLGLLGAGSMLFQFGGCSLDALVNQSSIGFARQLGAIPAQALYDAFIAPLVEGITGGGEEGA